MNALTSAEIAVIIVNYNTAELTLSAIESVLRQPHGGRRIAVHVVDNASPEGDAEILAAAIAERGWAADVSLRCETENHGFGRGNNLVLAQLAASPRPPRYAFLLNPDAKLDNDAIGITADFLDSHPVAMVAGARIVSPEGFPATAAFRFPGILSTFSSALSFGPISGLFRDRWVPLSAELSTQRVDWVAGAAMLMRLADVRRVGGFDPTYFLYFEEVDLMRQIRRVGGEVWHVAEARVVHAEGAATGIRSGGNRRSRLPAYWYESWSYYFRKHHGRVGALLAATAWYIGAFGNELIQALRRRPATAPERFYGDFWRLAVRPLLGLRPRES